MKLPNLYMQRHGFKNSFMMLEIYNQKATNEIQGD